MSLEALMTKPFGKLPMSFYFTVNYWKKFYKMPICYQQSILKYDLITKKQVTNTLTQGGVTSSSKAHK